MFFAFWLREIPLDGEEKAFFMRPWVRIEALNPALQGSVAPAPFSAGWERLPLSRRGEALLPALLETFFTWEKSSRFFSSNRSDSRGIFDGKETGGELLLVGFLVTPIGFLFLGKFRRIFTLFVSSGKIGRVLEEALSSTDILLIPSFWTSAHVW